MAFEHLSAQQLAFVTSSLQQLRERLASDALQGAANAGFGDVGARNLAAMMSLIGGAQLMALTHKKLYSVFRLLCVEMAQGSAESVMMRKLEEMGPEMFGGDIAPPPIIVRG